MAFEWPNRDPGAPPEQIEGIPPYYGLDDNGVSGNLQDGDIVNVIGDVNAGSSKLFRFEMSDGGYIGSRYRVHNDRNDIDYAKNVLLSGVDPVIVDVENSTQTQDTFDTSIDLSTLDNA